MKFFIFFSHQVKNAVNKNLKWSSPKKASLWTVTANSLDIYNLIMKLVHFLFSIRYFHKSYVCKCVLTY